MSSSLKKNCANILLCKDSKIDTIFNLDGETFVFKGMIILFCI